MSNSKKSGGIEKKIARWGVIFVIPAVLFFAVFSFYPIINAFIESFFDKRVLSNVPPKFVGLQNYFYIFDASRYDNPMSFLNSLRATVVFTLGTFIPLAHQLIEPGRFKKSFSDSVLHACHSFIGCRCGYLAADF